MRHQAKANTKQKFKSDWSLLGSLIYTQGEPQTKVTSHFRLEWPFTIIVHVQQNLIFILFYFQTTFYRKDIYDDQFSCHKTVLIMLHITHFLNCINYKSYTANMLITQLNRLDTIYIKYLLRFTNFKSYSHLFCQLI